MERMVLKSTLHDYIEQADNEHLEAMYAWLGYDMKPKHQYDAATLDMLYKRVENDLNGKSKSYTVAEAMALIKNDNRK